MAPVTVDNMTSIDTLNQAIESAVEVFLRRVEEECRSQLL
jgi:hypothetical protein